MGKREHSVCPVELAGSLDNRLRRIFQNPRKIIAPYITEGKKVADIGCGPGFFTLEMACLAGPSGKVYAVDMQEGMLQKVKEKIKGTYLEERIATVRNESENIVLPEKVDFILAFYMVHEVPDKEMFFASLKNNLAENGKMLVVEPPFHVSKKEFAKTIKIAESAGFVSEEGPKFFLQSAVLLS